VIGARSVVMKDQPARMVCAATLAGRSNHDQIHDESRPDCSASRSLSARPSQSVVDPITGRTRDRRRHRDGLQKMLNMILIELDRLVPRGERDGLSRRNEGKVRYPQLPHPVRSADHRLGTGQRTRRLGSRQHREKSSDELYRIRHYSFFAGSAIALKTIRFTIFAHDKRLFQKAS